MTTTEQTEQPLVVAGQMLVVRGTQTVVSIDKLDNCLGKAHITIGTSGSRWVEVKNLEDKILAGKLLPYHIYNEGDMWTDVERALYIDKQAKRRRRYQDAINDQAYTDENDSADESLEVNNEA